MSASTTVRHNRMQNFTPGAVRARRVERELTQVELALRAGISISLLRWAELGLMSARTIERLARALGCDPADLR